MDNREKIIVKASMIGIITNVFLSLFKIVIGFLANSIAIILDAVNNLSDALSSVITIIGTKLAGKEPDKEHPYGHGRIEYLSSTVISIIVTYAGLTSLIESVKKIIHTEIPDYTPASLIIVFVAVLVKIALGTYVKNTGKKVKSESLIDSGRDALMDSVISASTLVAAVIFIATKVSLEAYLGTIISVIILKSGFEMLKSSVSQILGERVDKELTDDIIKTVMLNKNVKGAYDLILNNYGPNTHLGSIHVEVRDTMTAAEIDEMTREIMDEVYKKHRVIITAVGIYSLNTKDEEVIKIRNDISALVHSYKNVIQMHGFYLNKEEMTISFDIILDFTDRERHKTYKEIYKKVEEKYPQYKLNITLDMDATD